MSKIISIADWWLFYPLACLLLGFAVGFSLDTWIRHLSGEKKAKLATLGRQMTSMADDVRHSNRYAPWPEHIKDIRPELNVIFLNTKKLKIPPLDDRIYKSPRGYSLIIDYFEFVGTHLKNGHVDAAKKFAQETIDKVEADIKSRQRP